MQKKLLKAWALFLLMLIAMPVVANDFNSQRTDFRDESRDARKSVKNNLTI